MIIGNDSEKAYLTLSLSDFLAMAAVPNSCLNTSTKITMFAWKIDNNHTITPSIAVSEKRLFKN